MSIKFERPQKRQDDPSFIKVADQQAAVTRVAFEDGVIYPAATICALAAKDSPEYVQRLLFDKFETIRRHNRGGLLVDLCCATGDHILEVRQSSQDAIGIDFSLTFLQLASEKCKEAQYIAADARKLPLATSSVSLLYSLSALYLVPDLDRVIAEVHRVLQMGGRCVLDLGNRESINSYCVRYHYPELPTSYYLTVAEMIDLCSANGLRIIEHRAFQILPLWAGRPSWLLPLLHPSWKRVMSIRLAGRMLDEWISGCYLFRRFAFRQILVCEKINKEVIP